jgi:2-keto-4-pentenoate hydratase/2-oxohepta-3-ene-1,7-dioic acid hydratase in catechol pathway
MRRSLPVAVGRIWVVLGGFLDAPGAALAPGTVPRLVPKVVTGVSGDGGEIRRPPGITGELAVEGELALVIGTELRDAGPAAALAGIAGYTCFNDATALEFLAQAEWSLAKSFDTFASVGPWIETDLAEDRIMQGLEITTRVNGDERQRGTTKLFKFRPSEVVSHLSRHSTLLPGDVVSLGTPPPPAVVCPGDRVEIEVEGLGVLHNTIVG